MDFWLILTILGRFWVFFLWLMFLPRNLAEFGAAIF